MVLPTPSMPTQHCQNYHFRSIIDNSSLSNTINPSRANLENEIEELERGFEPGPFDVICSQGKTAKSHAGNIHFHSVIQKRVKEYASSTEKRTKSKIVRNIIETIQAKSPNGGFVKKDSDGQWTLVGLEQTREKVSQSLRDTLSGRYRSSLMAKKKSRMESNLKRMIDFDEIIGSNKFVAEKMLWLAETIKNANKSDTNKLSDPKILKIMTETNLCILRQLKKDRMVQKSVRGEQQSQPQTVGNSERKTISLPPYSAVDQTLQRFHFDQEFLMQPSSKRLRK